MAAEEGLECYRVGGSVRDALLGRPVHDHDWVVVGATEDEMTKRGFRRVGSDFPVFLHPDTHEEYALARIERKIGVGHRGFECHSDPDVSLEEDLLRRDLTVNAIAEAIDGQQIDPFGGLADLAARKLRHVSPAFAEDPLRVLRCARFAAQLAPWGFVVAEETQELLTAMASAGELSELTPERVWQEWAKALLAPDPARFFEVLEACGAIPTVLPGLSLGRWSQRCQPLAALPGQVAERCAGLLLDEPEGGALLGSLRAPGEAQELTQICQRLDVLRMRDDDAETLLRTLEGVDALRRGARFERAVAVMEATSRWSAQDAAQLRALVAELGDVSVPDLRAQGFEGAALGEALRVARSAIVQRWVEQ